jgi:hypothetical protein
MLLEFELRALCLLGKLSTQHTACVLESWSPDGGAILGGVGNFRWGLTGGSSFLGAAFEEYLVPGSFLSLRLSAS